MAAYYNKLVLMNFVLIFLLAFDAHGQLTSTFYDSSCPNLEQIVRSVMISVVNQEKRMGASLIRLFFHDCFITGCDGSILLDDSANFTSEKNAVPNMNSVRGYEVIDNIKSSVEASCNATVSCADILALAARDAVYLLGGPTWSVQLGRRDALAPNEALANSDLPSPYANLTDIITKFQSKGLTAGDMTVLCGAHTVGQGSCNLFRSRLYNDQNINTTYAAQLKLICPQSGGNDTSLAPLDNSPDQFDNHYYRDLVARKGLFHSDQELFNNGSQDYLVRRYGGHGRFFAHDFAIAMVKLGNLDVLTGNNGEIRLNCSKVNS